MADCKILKIDNIKLYILDFWFKLLHIKSMEVVNPDLKRRMKPKQTEN